MKKKNLIKSLIFMVCIVAFGLIRMMMINYGESAIGQATMTGEFTLIAYVFIAIIVGVAVLAILEIKSIPEAVLSNKVKIICYVMLAVLFVPMTLMILLFYR